MRLLIYIIWYFALFFGTWADQYYLYSFFISMNDWNSNFIILSFIWMRFFEAAFAIAEFNYSSCKKLVKYLEIFILLNMIIIDNNFYYLWTHENKQTLLELFSSSLEREGFKKLANFDRLFEIEELKHLKRTVAIEVQAHFQA